VRPIRPPLADACPTIRSKIIDLSAVDLSVPASVLAARIDMILHAELCPLGFERAQPRRWVEGKQGPIRRIFEFQALKGEQYSACWGFSVDFVPALRGERLSWKRTVKTAKFDLCIDPIDLEGGPHDWCSLSRFIPPSKVYDWSKVARTVAATVKVAKQDFTRINSLGCLVAAFDERAKMKFRRFSLENYVQTHLAWGLCLLALGNRPEAEIHLAKFCETFSIDRNDRILRVAEQTAISTN
jgi:hypothetical protein